MVRSAVERNYWSVCQTTQHQLSPIWDGFFPWIHLCPRPPGWLASYVEHNGLATMLWMISNSGMWLELYLDWTWAFIFCVKVFACWQMRLGLPVHQNFIASACQVVVGNRRDYWGVAIAQQHDVITSWSESFCDYIWYRAAGVQGHTHFPSWRKLGDTKRKDSCRCLQADSWATQHDSGRVRRSGSGACSSHTGELGIWQNCRKLREVQFNATASCKSTVHVCECTYI